MVDAVLVCHAVRQHLLALQYREISVHLIDESRLHDSEWIRNIIVWLEDTKIRHYSVEDRKNLKSTEKEVWYSAVRGYVRRELNCPVQLMNGSQVYVSSADVNGPVLSTNEFLWVLGYAVGLAYDDGEESQKGYDDVLTDKIINSEVHPDGYSHARYGAALSDLHDQTSIEAFEELCAMLSIKREGRVTSIVADDVSKCQYRFSHEIVPLLRGKMEKMFLLKEGKEIQKIVPLGFTTGNDRSDLAVLMLRILHIKELRRLQNAIDEAIVIHQDMTANPRTETGRPKKKMDVAAS